ncbi:FapA family protein [Cohnella mopanensis]|uniref:FapA family protein n=1 Tax=Cohnella mopanensis TaxID=2911966 RepID=UPI001EF8AAB9|nr:FapA family protein [Cohnella mopanensis]
MKKQITESELRTLIHQLNIDRDNELAEGELDDPPSKQAGTIRIRNQQISVQDPTGGGERAVIYPMSPVKLYVNDEEVLCESPVKAADRVTWKVEELPLFEITISEDKMFAYLLVHAIERYATTLVDAGPAQRVIVRAQDDEKLVLKTVQLADVISELEAKSVKARIEFAAIQRELLEPTYKPIVVASGKEPVDGQDAKLEIYFPQQVTSEFFEVEGSIDYRNHLRIPTVQKDEVMARKIPMQEGVAGYDVLGNLTLPTPPKDIFIMGKPTVELTSDGVVIAKAQGRPRVTGGKIKTFDVSTAYVVSGNVEIATGNIVFSGDVVVYGDVTDNMIIESLGNVYIYGNVFNSTITATGSINVRGNVVASKLYSGYFGVLFNRLYHTSKLLCDYIEKLLAASRMLEQALEAKRQSVRYGQIVQLLLETKMKEIVPTIKELHVVISNIQHIKQSEYEKLKDLSNIFSKPTKLIESATYEYVQSFLALLQDTHKEVARMQEENVEISISQSQNSELKSNGDIVVHRDGVLLCELFSARNIVFHSSHSICRGSRLEAGDSILAKIIGGQTGAISVLKAKRKVQVHKMYSGRVCIGKYCKDFFEPIDQVTFDIQILKRNG